MRKYVKKEDKYTSKESVYKKCRWVTRYFYLYCNICGIKHPKSCVNQFDKEDRFGECEICRDCQNDLYSKKDRKCKQCKKPLKNLRKVVKLYFFDKTFYFRNSKCYIKYVKKKHPTTKKEWDEKFKKLLEKQKRIYYSNLRKVKRIVKELTKDNGIDYHTKGFRNACIWQRPKV